MLHPFFAIFLQVRKQLDELVSKNGDLSRANTELRHQTTELEMQIKEMHDKMSGSKAHIEHLGKIRKKQEMTLDKMQVRYYIVCF